MDKAIAWIEAHPVEATLIGLGGVVLLLYVFGVFGKSSSDGGASSLAAAYYAAEAQQAVVGGQIQQANIQATRDTAIAGIQANAAEAINQSNNNASTMINSQNVGAAMQLGDYQLLATESNNATTVATNDSNNRYAFATARDAATASVFNSYAQFVAPSEIAVSGGSRLSSPFGYFGTDTGDQRTPNLLASQGYTPQQIAAAFG